jgi:hypothetical protein
MQYVATDDPVPLAADDFRREHMLLSPSVFFWPDGEPEAFVPPSDLIEKDAWGHVMGLATHVALESSGYAGSVTGRLDQLHSDWVFSWPDPGVAPFINYPSLIAGEEFDALVFNALYGYYRQAISCLRVALETLTMAAGFAVGGDMAAFQAWQNGRMEAKFGRARVQLRDSADGHRIDTAASPESIFGDADDAWLNSRYKRLCDYTHSRAGHETAASGKAMDRCSYPAPSRPSNVSSVRPSHSAISFSDWPGPHTHPAKDSPLSCRVLQQAGLSTGQYFRPGCSSTAHLLTPPVSNRMRH